MSAGNRYRFGEFELDLARETLLRRGAEIALAPQPFALLTLLVERHDELVTREEAAHHLWGDRQVETEQGLNYCVRQIRLALEDSADSPAYLQTVPRRGYRFLKAVEPAAPPGTETIPERGGRRTRRGNDRGDRAGHLVDLDGASLTRGPHRGGAGTGRRAAHRGLRGRRAARTPRAGPERDPRCTHPRCRTHRGQPATTSRSAPRSATTRVGCRSRWNSSRARSKEPVWSASGIAAAENLGPLEQDLRRDLVASLRSVLDGTAIEGEQTIERSRSLPDEHEHDH